MKLAPMDWKKIERPYAYFLIFTTLICMGFTNLAAAYELFNGIWLCVAWPIMLFTIWYAWYNHLHQPHKPK